MLGQKTELPNTINAYDFGALAKQKRNARVRLRLIGFAHLKDGNSITATAKMCRVKRSTVYDWLDRFEQDGLEGLQEKEGRGRKSKLPKDQHLVFREVVLELQNCRPGGRIRGSDVLELMKTRYGVDPALSTVYNILKRADLVWITGRSIHPKADVEAQEAFKKTSEIR